MLKTLGSTLLVVAISALCPARASAFFAWQRVQLPNQPCFDSDDNLWGPGETNRVSITGGNGWLWSTGCNDTVGPMADGANSQLWAYNNGNPNAAWYQPTYFEKSYGPSGTWIPPRGDSVYS